MKTLQRASADGVGQVEQIIVSARRRNESLQTTPVAVTAIPVSQLEGTAALNMTALQGAAPNVVLTAASTAAASATISIRGIAFADIEKSFDPSVGVNVDGVYIGTSTGQLLDFFDIESIEILRGPQGTLFGRNTIAGVINIRRTRPTGEWGGKFELGQARFDQTTTRGVINVPLVPDVLAAKFFGFHMEHDGFYRNFYTGQRQGGAENENFGATFLLTPSDSFSALLTLEKQVQDFDPVNSSLSRTGDVFCTAGISSDMTEEVVARECDRNLTNDMYTTYALTPGFGRYRAPAATLEMELDVGAVSITSVSSYRKTREAQMQDIDALSSDLYVTYRRQDYRQFSQELRASGKMGDRLDYVAGLYYFDSQYDLSASASFFGGPMLEFQDTTGKSESYAAFFDFNWEIFDRVRLSGGGRYTHDEKQNLNPGIPGAERAVEDWRRFTPKIALDYRPSDDLMAYTSWSRGYRSGGFNGRAFTVLSATTPYDPETVDAYEVGIKSEFLDRRLALNVAAFYTDYKKIQQSSTVPLPDPPFNETLVVNAGGAKIKGIEADVILRPVDRLTISAAFGYTDSKFEDFLVGQLVGGEVRALDFSNVDMIYAPEVTAALSGTYRIPVQSLARNGEIKLNAGYRFLSHYDQQIAASTAIRQGITPGGDDVIVVPRNDPRVRSDDQNLLDASASFGWAVGSGQEARVTIFGRNLLNDTGPLSAFTVSSPDTLWGFASAREPRVYGVQLGYDF